MKIYILSFVISAIFCLSVTPMSYVHNEISKSENSEEKWSPNTYVQNVDLIYSSALKGIKAMLYVCGNNGLTQYKAEALESLLRLVLDSFKPLYHSEVVNFYAFIKTQVRNNANAGRNEVITSKYIYKHKVDQLNILGVDCDEHDCLEFYNDEPYTIWYLFHSLSIAKAYAEKKGEFGEITPYEAMQVIMNLTDQCIFNNDSMDNPFSSCGFGRCDWIKNIDYRASDEIRDSGMGLVMWLWRLHNAMCVEESLAQTTLAIYNGLKTSERLRSVNFLGQDVRFPPMIACKECRKPNGVDSKIITRDRLLKFINGNIELTNMDYIKDFSLEKTFDFLMAYYKDSRWYSEKYKIQWSNIEMRFKYIMIDAQNDVQRTQ